MAHKPKDLNDQQFDLHGIDSSILGQIMAAQNMLFVLPTKKNIAEFYAKLLFSIPGVKSCRICLGNSFSQEGVFINDTCINCEYVKVNTAKGPIYSKDFRCRLEKIDNSYVFALDTIDHRFGFFIFILDQPALFELYKPFLCNLGNFIALSLENRLQKNDLQNAKDVLEIRVKERTKELLEVNTQLEEEIEVRIHTEKALQQSEEQFRFLFETMVQGVIIQDAESKILDANDAACDILGLSRDQLLGKTAYDPRWKLIHEDGSALYPEEMPSNIALRTCQPAVDILIGAYIPEQDNYHWILTSSTPKFRYGENKPYLTMTTFSNITERKKAEKALYESQQVFRTLVENSPDIIARYNRDCKRIYVNPVYLREAKIPQQELLVTTPLQRSPLPSDSAVILQGLLNKVLESGVADSVDVMWPKDNINYWYNVYASPEFDREGKVASVLTISRDITARKEVEQERIEHLRYFESMDRINRALQNSNDLEQMMSDVLDVILSIFNCDRAFLAVPCDPTTPEFKISMERTVPLYPGAFARDEIVPMSPAVRNLFQALLDNPAPNEIFIGKGLDPDDVVWKTYEIKSQLAIALHPKIGKPWECGLHQCSCNRIWTPQEKQLFLEISRRLADGLTSLLTYRNLQESEQRYRMVFENSPVSIWEEDFSEVKNIFDYLKKEGIKDIENYFNLHPETVQQCAGLIKIIDVNQSALTLHAAATKQELMANLANTFTPESFDSFRQELIRLWNGETEITTDAVVKTFTGDLRNVTVYVSVCPGYEESLSKILVSLADITGRKLTENALIKSEKEFRALAENLPDVVVRYDIDARRIYVNPEFERVNRLTAQQIYGKTPVELSTELSPMAVVFTEKLMESLASGTNAKIDLSWTKDGKPICWFVRIVPEFDANGTVVSALTIWSDISERKQAEEEIRKLNQELEKRVNERTSQLEAANKELEAFSYSVSHDLRAPLRSIEGFSQLLLEEYQDILDVQGKNYFQRICKATQHMSELIEDMLNLSRVSRSNINIQQVNLSSIVKEIADNLLATEPGRHVKFIIHEGVIVQADSRLLRIVLENLTGNAWKFTSKHPEATIEFGVQQQEGILVYFIRDNGAGFDMNYAQRLFGAFQRLHTTNEFAGTGIGLATVQRIIHRHGGKVWAEGEVEKGATFYFTIPLTVM